MRQQSSVYFADGLTERDALPEVRRGLPGHLLRSARRLARHFAYG
jgi:hypothetical protein